MAARWNTSCILPGVRVDERLMVEHANNAFFEIGKIPIIYFSSTTQWEFGSLRLLMIAYTLTVFSFSITL